MATQLLYNIGQLISAPDGGVLSGGDMANIDCLHHAYCIVEDGVIAETGTMDAFFEHSDPRHWKKAFDAASGFLLPAWCDSHTHLVFAGSREAEFVDKIRGKSYAEIHAAGGGILNSARKLGETSEEELFRAASARLEELAQMGTGAVEIKSGYGLTVEGELKMLRVIRRLKETSRLTIKSTFLGAHAYPEAFRQDHEGYLQQIIQDMLPVIAREKLADYIDVFCEEGFFSLEETERVIRAGLALGLKPKLHVNQLHAFGGIGLGLRLHARSVDHLEQLTETDLQALSAANDPGDLTIATLLPTAAFFLRLPPPPARALIDAGCAVALASDYNPGSSPSGNMNLVFSMACIQLRLLPEEALNAGTLNGAWAMDCGKELGSISPGKKANLIITQPVPSLAYLPYAFGNNHIRRVMIGGEFIA